jgi:hypothetical protein
MVDAALRHRSLLEALEFGIEPDREVGRFHNCKP